MEKIIALVGNPNCGKTTLFNRLTGSSARVGNWPGVTIEKRSGYYRGIISIVDLPGIYALSSFSPDEKVACDYISAKKADAVINIVDATCMERSLYLTTQLLEMDIPVIVAVNFMDEAKRRGIKIDISALTEKLGIEVVPVSAVKDKNFDTLINAALKMNKPIFAPVRKYESYQKSALERYNLIEQKLMPHIIVPPKISVTSVVDKIALNKFFALPIFTVIMLFVFYIVFGPVGNILKTAARFLMSVLSNGAENILIKLGLKSTDFLYSLLLDGVFGGVGEVLCFLPQILLLFLLLSLIEASGYMARAAFLTDGVLRRFSLTGKSVVPLLMGFGCSVPAIMSSRIIENPSQRRMTALLIPFMPCSAKLPVFVLLSSAVMGEKYWLAVAFMYLLGIASALFTGGTVKRTLLKGNNSTFLTELPDYRLPTLRNIAATLKEKSAHFISKAGTVILLGTFFVFVLRETGLLNFIGGLLSPIFLPLGFGTADLSVSAISGFIAKEMVVSTLAMLSNGEISADIFSVASMLSFLTYCLISPPCMASCAALIGEMKSAKLSFGVLIYYLTFSWLVSFIVYRTALIVI